MNNQEIKKIRLERTKERLHLIKGLMIAQKNILEVASIILSSEKVEAAQKTLEDHFSLTNDQSNAIVNMRLRALAAYDRGMIEREYSELMKEMEELSLG